MQLNLCRCCSFLYPTSSADGNAESKVQSGYERAHAQHSWVETRLFQWERELKDYNATLAHIALPGCYIKCMEQGVAERLSNPNKSLP